MSETPGPTDPVPATSAPAAPVPADQQSAPPPPKTKPPKPAKQRTPEQVERRKTIIRFALFVVVGALLTVALYFILSAFIPRWWAQVVGRQANGRISGGILLGLFYGFTFTVLPLLVLAQAVRRSFSWQTKVVLVLIAAALTAPNLMTLGISIGNSAAAHAGERTLDVLAPGFRQASLWGAVAGGLLAAAIITVWLLWERRSDELKTLRARVEELQKELPPALPAPAAVGESEARKSILPKRKS